jgi:hypothetical protein
MNNEMMKQESHELDDGFTGYVDETDNEEGPSAASNRVIQGTKLLFTNEAIWVDDAGEELPTDLELVVVGIARLVQKWGKDPSKPPIETIVLKSGERYPDVETMNEQCPKSEWREGFNCLQGPWQAARAVYFVDLKTMTRYTWVTSTVGGSIAIRDLVDRVDMMRRFKGMHVFAVVTLTDVHMNTRFGGRQRPCLLVKNWVLLDGSGAALPVSEKLALTEVKPSSVKKVTGDEIPY